MLDNIRSMSLCSSVLLGRSVKILNNASSKRTWELTQEAFDRLLGWLNPDREEAGKEYQKIHALLVKGFMNHDCALSEAESLADETINRVTKKLPEIEATYVGNPSRYFFGVAHNVRLEHLRRASRTERLPPWDIPNTDLSPEERLEDIDPEYTCLEQCMRHLTQRNRELILKYYQGEKHIKIELRKVLAQQLGIGLPLLRLQAQRIRESLKKCILGCLAQRAA
jgi:DNA-directed RNA polymerase specialized sigma24 family protein